MYLYIILHDKLLLSLYYSDLARNNLKGPIPKEWGSLTNIYKLYELSLTFLIWFFNIDYFILYDVDLDIWALFYILYRT